MNSEIMETARTGGIATVGVTYSFLGMPWSTYAAIATVVYMVLKILQLLPEVYSKYFNRDKDESG